MIFFEKKEYSLSFINNICYVAPGTGKAFHPDRPFHGLVFYKSNDCAFNFENFGRYETLENSVIYLPKGSSYRVEKLNEQRGCFAINFDLVEDIDEKPFVFRSENGGKLENLFVLAEKYWKSKSIDKRYKCRALFYEILSLICAESSVGYQPSEKKEKLKEAVEYIHSSYLEKEIRVEELALLSDMSTAYFRKLFGVVYHVSPIKYINHLKIEHAKELIMSDMYPTNEIAQLSGFSDDCYFRRVFKNETGLSPREYRKTKK